MVITFHPPYEGHFNDTLELIFYDLRQKERFSIIRQISAIVGSPQDHETLKSKGPFARKKWKPLPLPIIIRRPPTWTKTQWRVRLPLFDAPKDLIDHAFGVKNRHKSVRINHLPAVFSENSHGKWFQVLAYIEEEQRRLV
jgi:helicase MOV-10